MDKTYAHRTAHHELKKPFAYSGKCSCEANEFGGTIVVAIEDERGSDSIQVSALPATRILARCDTIGKDLT